MPSGWKRSDARVTADLVIQANERAELSPAAVQAKVVTRGVRNGMLQVMGIIIAASLLLGLVAYYVAIKPGMDKAAERERVRQVENDIKARFR